MQYLQILQAKFLHGNVPFLARFLQILHDSCEENVPFLTRFLQILHDSCEENVPSLASHLQVLQEICRSFLPGRTFPIHGGKENRSDLIEL